MTSRLLALAVFGSVALLTRALPEAFYWSDRPRGYGIASDLLDIAVSVLPFVVVVAVMAYAAEPFLSARAEAGSSGWIEGAVLFVVAESVLLGLSFTWELVSRSVSGSPELSLGDWGVYWLMIVGVHLTWRCPIAGVVGAFAGDRFFRLVGAA